MKFIHFGCWNNGNCNLKKLDNGLSKMMDLLNKKIDSEKIDFITIAGDNYYPEKGLLTDGKKVKKMNIENFLSGFMCLPKNIKKYLLFGNHDLEDVITNNDNEKEECKALLLQKYLFDDNNKYELFNNVLIKKTANTLILMIDTTIYSLEPTENISDTCYTYLFQSNTHEKISELLELQERQLTKVLQENIDIQNIIIIGHHPIISAVSKKGINKITANNNFINLLKKLNTCFIGKNIYYLCADTHFYQYSIIDFNSEFSINQFIVGTGGAEQDNIPVEPYIINYEDLIYSIIVNQQKYGFLEIEINDTINFLFNSIESDGGYYNKYIKYKTKYNNLKKMNYNNFNQ